MNFEDVKTDKDMLQFMKGKWDINNPFWIFTHLGLGDAIVCNALFRHYAELHKDKYVILPQWTHNIAAVQWMLSDVPNIFFYPIETEQQLLTCRDSLNWKDILCLGFYSGVVDSVDIYKHPSANKKFNPVLWDSEFYRQAGLDPELKWMGFKLPKCSAGAQTGCLPKKVYHHDEERGFRITDLMQKPLPEDIYILSKNDRLGKSAIYLSEAEEIHCIDSSMLNLADLMDTPYCKRFVFHRYARRGLPPTLKKNWEIIE